MATMGALAAPSHWSTGALVLVLTTIILLVVRNVTNRPPLPSGSAWTDKGWPFTGSLGFFAARGDFLRQGKQRSSNGHFNFYYGSYPIIAVTGNAARAAYYTTRGLDLNAAFRALFDHFIDADFTSNFAILLKRLMTKDNLVNILPVLHDDINDAYTKIDTSVPWDPFDTMYCLVYKMTHRVVGCDDIANDPKLLQQTLKIYGNIDKPSPLEVMFPSLPTPGKISKVWSAIRLHWTFSKIVADRKKTGRRANDAMQMLMDRGDSDKVISAFIIVALFAGLINSGIHAARILIYLAHDSYWYAEMQAEVDAAVAKYRSSDEETPVDILQRLPMDAWESEFPLINAGLREGIRLNMPGCSFRQNISGKDITMSNIGVVVPNNAFVAYHIEDIHMDPHVYTDPLKWDPGRYLPDRAEDKKVHFGYLGWGLGLHPCLGIKFAKLEIIATTATFMASFDFKSVDKNGNEAMNPLKYDDNNLEKKPTFGAFYLKCTRRF